MFETFIIFNTNDRERPHPDVYGEEGHWFIDLTFQDLLELCKKEPIKLDWEQDCYFIEVGS